MKAFGKDKVTTGASSDIRMVTDTARRMVTEWGLSDKLGFLAYEANEQEVFLGKSASQNNKNISNETVSSIDAEIRKIIDTQYTRATKLIKDNLDKMHLMADALMKYETIDVEQIDQIMEGKVPDAPDSWSDDDNSSSGKPSDMASKDSPSASPAS